MSASWAVWRVAKVTCRPRAAPDGRRCKVRLEWYPPGHGGRMATRVRTGTRREIEALAGEIIAAGYAAPARWGDTTTADPGLVTFLDLLGAWLYQIEEGDLGAHLSPTTAQLYRYAVRRVLGTEKAPQLRGVRLDTWGAAEARAWQRRRAAAVSQSAFQHDRSVVCQAWEWAAEEGLITAPCPLRGMAYPTRYGGRRHRRHTPSAEEVAATLAQLPDTPQSWHYRRQLVVLWATGARVGEVLALTRADIDLRGGWVTLQGAVDGQRTGKGRGEAAYRRVPLSGDAQAALTEVIEQLPPGQGRLWPGIVDTLSANLAATVRRYAEKAGVPHWSPHGLRRLAVDTMARSRVDIGTAAAITGHSPQVMLKNYRRVSETDKRGALQRAGLGRIPGQLRVVVGGDEEG